MRAVYREGRASAAEANRADGVAARVCYPPDTVAFTSTRLRWYIGGLLFLSTVINYVDRQTLSVLAPYLKTEYAWTNTDFAWIIIAFRVAYSIGQTVAGRWLDRVGTRQGLSVAVLWYSVAAMLTSLAVGLKSFAALPLPARRRRGGQLAGRDEGGLGVVPAPRERLGGRAVRQRIVGRRGDRAGPRAVAVPHLRHVAAGVRHHRRARPALAAALPAVLPPAREPSLDLRRGARLHPGRPRAGRGRRADAAPAPARCRRSRLLGLRQTWGIIARQGAHRSGLVLHHRLVRDLPRRPRLRARGRACSRSGCRSWPRTPATSSAAASPAI